MNNRKGTDKNGRTKIFRALIEEENQVKMRIPSGEESPSEEESPNEEDKLM